VPKVVPSDVDEATLRPKEIVITWTLLPLKELAVYFENVVNVDLSRENPIRLVGVPRDI